MCDTRGCMIIQSVRFNYNLQLKVPACKVHTISEIYYFKVILY